MEKIVLKAQSRSLSGKGPNRRLRAEGKVPAILYGGEGQPQSLTLSEHALKMALKQTHTMMTLNYEGAEMIVMVGEIQRDPLSNALVHVDLTRVQAGHEVHAHLEVIGQGAPIGVREGGVLERPVREVEIRCLPKDLPEKIEIDITNLQVNESIKAGDLSLGEGIHLVTDPDTLLFHVAVPKAAVEAAAEEAEEEAQPELVGKKKEDEGEEEK